MYIKSFFQKVQVAVLDLIYSDANGDVENICDTWECICHDNREFDVQVVRDDATNILSVIIYDRIGSITEVDSYFPVFNGTGIELIKWLDIK